MRLPRRKAHLAVGLMGGRDPTCGLETSAPPLLPHSPGHSQLTEQEGDSGAPPQGRQLQLLQNQPHRSHNQHAR